MATNDQEIERIVRATLLECAKEIASQADGYDDRPVAQRAFERVGERITAITRYKPHLLAFIEKVKAEVAANTPPF